MSAVSSEPVRPLANWKVALLITLGVVVLFFTSQVAGGLVLGLYASVQHWNAAQINDWVINSIPAQFAYGVIAEGALIAGVWWGLRWLRWGWSYIGLTKPTIIHVFVGLLAVVPYFICYLLLLTFISTLVPGLNINQRQDIGFTNAVGTPDLILAFIALVIVPAFAEEITMRGLLYTGLKKWLPTLAAALIVSVLFGAAHLAEGGPSGPLWVGAIDTFTLSLVLVFLREKTGSLWPGITLHAVKNSIAFVALFFIK